MSVKRLALAAVACLALALVMLAVAVGCGLMPERFAVNGPVLHQLIGVGGGSVGGESLTGLEAPEGFAVTLFASDVSNARFLRFTSSGDLLVSSPRAGEVLLVRKDADGDGRSDGTSALLDGLDRPHGLDFHEGWLYVGESGAIGRVRYDAEARSVEGEYARVVEGLPAGGNHWTRSVGFGPDGWLYVSIGSSCNVCKERDPRRAALLRYRPDGSGEEIYATGLRNSVGFDWRPATGELYATDNGRDLLGDDFPPCELNRIERGQFYGWPYANGDRQPDPDFGRRNREKVERSVSPVHAFAAHNAPLGIRFVTGAALPPAYRGAALVALHGSWNRTRKDGYKVVSLHWQDGGITERDFLTGFLRDDDVIGRPVDVAEGPDGALYVSDDYGNAIYRVVHADTPGAAVVEATASAPAAPGRGLASAGAPDRGNAARRGAQIYDALPCAGCHDPEQAQAGVVARPLAGLSTRYELDTLASFLAAPTPPMPAFALSAAERRDLAAHLLERHP